MLFRSASKYQQTAGGALLYCFLAVQTAPAANPTLSLEQLTCMSWEDLEQIYRQAVAGTIPAGYARGRAIYCPGAFLSPARSKITKTIWHGKLFCPADSTLVNQWCLGIRAIRARVASGPSWLDGEPAIIMDYCGMSHVWNEVRDEIREVAPGLYLGVMYRRKAAQPQRKMFFALELTPPCP
jgi:hypothetical protein